MYWRGERFEKLDCVCLAHEVLKTHPRRSLFREPPVFSQLLVQFSLPRVLDDEVDSLGVVEIAVKTEDVLVSQVALDLNLSAQLLFDLVLLQLALEQDLQSNDIAAPLFSREVDTAKLALAECATDVEILESPAFFDRVRGPVTRHRVGDLSSKLQSTV